MKKIRMCSLLLTKVRNRLQMNNKSTQLNKLWEQALMNVGVAICSYGGGAIGVVRGLVGSSTEVIGVHRHPSDRNRIIGDELF